MDNYEFYSGASTKWLVEKITREKESIRVNEEINDLCRKDIATCERILKDRRNGNE